MCSWVLPYRAIGGPEVQAFSRSPCDAFVKELVYRATLLLQLAKNNMMVVDYFFPSDAEEKWQVVLQATDKQNDKMEKCVILHTQDEHENTS
jgi:hypothetical protein